MEEFKTWIILKELGLQISKDEQYREDSKIKLLFNLSEPEVASVVNNRLNLTATQTQTLHRIKILNQLKVLEITNNMKKKYLRDSVSWRLKPTDTRSIGLSLLVMNYIVLDNKEILNIELCTLWLVLSLKKCQRNSVTVKTQISSQ